MKSTFSSLLLLVLAAFASSPGEVQGATPTARDDGRERLPSPRPSPHRMERGSAGQSAPNLSGYVRLADWANSHHFELCWLKGEETLQLSSASAKVLLGIDSREARLNGVLVWLAFPVLYYNSTVYIAQLDLRTTLQPLLFPVGSGEWGVRNAERGAKIPDSEFRAPNSELRTPKGRSGSPIRTVCLDPGHGGKDPGNRVGSNEEKKFTLLLAREVREQLKQAGLKVVLTRSADSFVELPVRPELARRRNADLFVSLHFNAAEHNRESVKGAEVYCLTAPGASSTNTRGEAADTAWCAGNRYNERNLCLAYQVQKALIQSLCVEDRGVRRARFAVLREAVMPAVLIEAGFMSHPGEGGKIFTEAYRRQIARAIVEGLLAYKRAIEVGQTR